MIPTTVTAGGIPALVEAYALREIGESSEVVLLSLVGSSTAVSAVWASLVKGDPLRLGEGENHRYCYCLHREDGEAVRYRQFRKVLPKFGKVHNIVIAETALTTSVRPGEGFFVIAKTGAACRVETEETFRARWKTAWDRAVPHPALDSWGSDLFARGRSVGLVVDLTAEGCRAVMTDADPEKWKPIISRLARGKEILE